MTRTLSRQTSLALALGLGGFAAAMGCKVDDRELVDNLDTVGDGDGDGDSSGGTSGDGDGDSSGGISGDGDGDGSGGFIGDGDGDLGTGGGINPDECGVGDNAWINGYIGTWEDWRGHVSVTVPSSTSVEVLYEGYDPVCLLGTIPPAQPESPIPEEQHPSFVVDWQLNVLLDNFCQGDPQELYLQPQGVEVELQNVSFTPLMVVLSNDYTTESWCAPLVSGGTVEAIPFYEFRTDCMNPGGDSFDLATRPVTRLSIVAQDQGVDTDVNMCIVGVRGVTRPFCWEPLSGCRSWQDYENTMEMPSIGDCISGIDGLYYTFMSGNYELMCGPSEFERDPICTDSDNTFEVCTPYGSF